MESGADTLGDAVTALYRLLPDEFTAARSALAEKVRAEGNDLLAARIRKIPKPTLPAYWVNRVAAQWPVELASLLAVGAELRQATQQRDRERLASLDRQRRIQTDALLSLLWQFGENEAKAGRKKPSQATLTRVSETLTAAVMDIEVAPLVGSGAVARPFLHEGFGLLDVPEDDRSETTAPVTSLHAKRALTSVPPLTEESAAVSQPVTSEPGGDGLVERATAQLVDAEEALTAARAHSEALHAELGSIEGDLAALSARRDATRSKTAEADKRLREAERSVRITSKRLTAMTSPSGSPAPKG